MLATIMTTTSVGREYMRLTHSRGANAVKKLLSYGFGHTKTSEIVRRFGQIRVALFALVQQIWSSAVLVRQMGTRADNPGKTLVTLLLAPASYTIS